MDQSITLRDSLLTVVLEKRIEEKPPRGRQKIIILYDIMRVNYQ